MMSVSLRFSGMSTLRIKCVFSYENVVFIPQLVVVYMERVRGERPTASSPGEALQLLKAISCPKALQAVSVSLSERHKEDRKSVLVCVLVSKSSLSWPRLERSENTVLEY